MSFEIAIIGLPNAGKSTLFNLLTKIEVDIASYPFTTINPNVGVVEIPDKRVEEIANITLPEKKIYPILEFIDIAGLIEGAHKGEGLGNRFLSHIRGAKALLQVIDSFSKRSNPEKDKAVIEKELLMKDLEHLTSLAKKMRGDKRIDLIRKIKKEAENGTPLREIKLSKEEEEKIHEFQFLTLKPISFLYNGGEKSGSFDLKLEKEMINLSETEKEELGIKSQLDQLTLNCYNSFALITFFTVAGNKVQGWTIKDREITKAAEMVHSDFKEKFKRAEVTTIEGLKSGSFKKARSEGKVKSVGKDYLVKDGDIIEFKI